MSNMIFVSIELLSEETLKNKYNTDKPVSSIFKDESFSNSAIDAEIKMVVSVNNEDKPSISLINMMLHQLEDKLLKDYENSKDNILIMIEDEEDIDERLHLQKDTLKYLFELYFENKSRFVLSI